jgi:hypothetical protein
VILSLLFRGISRKLKGEEKADGVLFAAALQEGVDAAYKAVMKPAEGTILTVSRLAARAARIAAKDNNYVDSVLEAAVAAAKAEAEEAAKKLYAEKYGKPKSKLKSVVYDGDEERPDDEVVEGCIFINTSSTRQPGIAMLESGLLVEARDDEDVYSGCYGAADINFFPYSAPTANGIGCGLNNILKLEDGPRLGGGSRNADAAFADLV